MMDPRHYLDKAQALVAMLPSGPSIKLHRRQCSCLQEKLEETFDVVVGRVESYNRVPMPVQYEKVFEEFRHLVRKVKTFVEDCCYEDDDDFVMAAIRVIAHRERFFQYHVELDWCSFLVKCLWDADNSHHKTVYSQTLQKFDWEQNKSLFLKSGEASNMIADDEGDLRARLESWMAKAGEHQAICWALLRRLGSNTESDLHIDVPGQLGVPPISSTLGKCIGEGSYGRVHEIKWKEKLFAVKSFQIGNVETTNDEVKILERCCHPHIVNLILAYKEEKFQYLMMERLSWDLESYIDERKKQGTFPVPTSEVVDMISQICEGMVYLNVPGRKVSHRDLKPKNILVKELKPVTDSEIPAIELQVADFGMAKEREEKSSISENPPNCGTLRYRAPEMTGKPGGDNIRASSMRADMYSFAVTCSFILTGTVPFSDCHTTESLKQAIEDGERPDLPGNCPPALAALLRRCWASLPENRPESFSEILTELRKLKANLLRSAIEGVEPQEEVPIVTFPGNRRLNILVLGDPELVEAVVSRVCGAGRSQTQVEGHVNLRESRSSSPPMCLYVDTQGISRNYFTDSIMTFVKVRNEKWLRAKVEALWELWVKAKRTAEPRNPSALFPGSDLRLHAIWFACRELSDLPNLLRWPEIIEKLCDLPVQVMVIEQQRIQDLDMNFQREFEIIYNHGSDFFPNAQMFMEELIVEVALNDYDLKGKLWRACWAVRTRVEIGNAAKIIRELRKKLGSAGISVESFAGARIPKEGSLSRSGEFLLSYLCTYWDIPQHALRRILPQNFFQECSSKISIKPYEFVEFCLIVAAIILYNAHDNAVNPNVSSESSLDQLLQTEARDFYDSDYFRPTLTSLYYDRMAFDDIRLFLESIFERRDWDPRPVESVERKSSISRIMKLIYPR